ncbi:hypothetical protein COB11_00325 [Candidatus Aerophobetes bacterium]|uniref:DoxX family protein n=1 Tax=Aerophobetes bacterium TaxID=2030807 RepID=A0A2A4YMV0_UNCAE|nr:MAG: hypothetical protein COB11_00325 [Candidatus Aerophobetes bacterium]
MHSFKITFSIVGRILLCVVFILAGIHKIMNWDGTLQALQTALDNWKMYSGPNPLFGVINLMQEYLTFTLGLAIAFEILGGLFVLIGVLPRFGAILLIIFLSTATILFYPFWYIESPERNTQLVGFMKNLAILGGLFVVFGFGSGFRSKSNL